MFLSVQTVERDCIVIFSLANKLYYLDTEGYPYVIIRVHLEGGECA